RSVSYVSLSVVDCVSLSLSSLSLHDALPILKSAPKRARPVTLSAPSGRMVRVPTYVCELPLVIVSAMGLSLSHRRGGVHHRAHEDRKSTRLNSSHGSISYAVFCLKKKTLSSLD